MESIQIAGLRNPSEEPPRSILCNSLWGVGSHPGDVLPRASLPPPLLVPVFGSWHTGLHPWGQLRPWGSSQVKPAPPRRCLQTGSLGPYSAAWGLRGLCSPLFQLHCVAGGPRQDPLTVPAIWKHSPVFPGTGAPCYSYSSMHIFPLDSTQGLIF